MTKTASEEKAINHDPNEKQIINRGIAFWKQCSLDIRLNFLANFIEFDARYDYTYLVEARKHFGSCLSLYIKEYDVGNLKMLYYDHSNRVFFTYKPDNRYENFGQIPKPLSLDVHTKGLTRIDVALGAVQEYFETKQSKSEQLDETEKRFHTLVIKLSEKIDERFNYNLSVQGKLSAGKCPIL